MGSDAEYEYEPVGTFEVDMRPMSAAEVVWWRKQATLTPAEIARRENNPHYRKYPAGEVIIAEMAKRIGVTAVIWGRWEREGCTNPRWCALVREHVETGNPIPRGAANEYDVRFVADVVGGAEGLAEFLQVVVATSKKYLKTGAPAGHGSGPLIRYLVNECDVDTRGLYANQ